MTAGYSKTVEAFLKVSTNMLSMIRWLCLADGVLSYFSNVILAIYMAV